MLRGYAESMDKKLNLKSFQTMIREHNDNEN